MLVVVARVCHTSCGEKCKTERKITAQASLGKKRDPISKITRAKKAGCWLKL
jgi:hypothetical protein